VVVGEDSIGHKQQQLQEQGQKPADGRLNSEGVCLDAGRWFYTVTSR